MHQRLASPRSHLLMSYSHFVSLTRPMTASEHQTPVQVPGGLVHHWMVIALMHGITADQVPSYQKRNLATELDQCRARPARSHTHYGRVRKIGRPSLWSYLGR